MTEETFFKVFVCCLYWQWQRGDYNHMYTSVDKVVRILGVNGLGVLTKAQITALRSSMRFQGILKIHSRVMMARTFNSDADGILATPSSLVVRVGLGRNVDWRRVVRGCPIFLTDKGAEAARGYEPGVAHIITADSYRAECKRQDDAFLLQKGAARAAICDQYRKNVDRDVRKKVA